MPAEKRAVSHKHNPANLFYFQELTLGKAYGGTSPVSIPSSADPVFGNRGVPVHEKGLGGHFFQKHKATESVWTWSWVCVGGWVRVLGGCGEAKLPWVLDRVRMGLGDGEEKALARMLYFMGRPDDRGKLVWSTGSMGQHLALPAW